MDLELINLCQHRPTYLVRFQLPGPRFALDQEYPALMEDGEVRGSLLNRASHIGPRPDIGGLILPTPCEDRLMQAFDLHGDSILWNWTVAPFVTLQAQQHCFVLFSGDAHIKNAYLSPDNFCRNSHDDETRSR